MQCIGDECAKPKGVVVKTRSRGPLMRSVAVGAIFAGLGYFAAQSRQTPDSNPHLVAIAPPMVMVSEIGD